MGIRTGEVLEEVFPEKGMRFATVEERILRFRDLYRESPVSAGTGLAGQMAEACFAKQEGCYVRNQKPGENRALGQGWDVVPGQGQDVALKKGRDAASGIGCNVAEGEGRTASDRQIQGQTESRIMEGDFATLLCLYHQGGAELGISRRGIRSVYHEMPHQGRYHKHQYIEIFYVAQGSFEQILLGEKRHFSQGEVVITDQNCEHADYLPDEDAAVLFLWLRPKYLDSLLESCDGKDGLRRFLFHALSSQKREQSFLQLKAEPGAEGIGRVLELLVEEDYERASGYQDIIRGCLIRLFHMLCTSYALQLHSDDRESKEKVLLYEVERYIRLHTETVTAQQMEEIFHYHRNYYNLLLKKYRDKSFRQYVQEIRIKRAGELLRNTRLPVKQVAFQMGYENSSFFYRIFERYYKMTPLEYRRTAE